MKKVLAALAITVLAAGTAYAAPGVSNVTALPGEGVFGSNHDMNVISATLQRDDQGRVCAFCHTPHHAEDLLGEYNPLWAHDVTALVGATPYASATFDYGNTVGNPDPLIGPSRLCMSCHDGNIAPDQHYGTTFPGTPIGALAGSKFVGDDYDQIAIGLNDNFGNDHPIGFAVTAYGTGGAGDDIGIFADTFTTREWMSAGVADSSGTLISAGLYNDGSELWFTCATCHDVHNKDNVPNDNTLQADADHADTVGRNYFVFAPQSGSQLCLSCHDK